MSYNTQIYTPKLSVYIDGYGSISDRDILSISQIKQSFRAWTGEFDIGNFTVRIKDPDYLYWGTFSPACLNIFNPIGRKVILYSDGIIRNTQICRDISLSNGALELSCSDILEDLKKCKFQYDYEPVNDTLTYTDNLNNSGWTVEVKNGTLEINDLDEDRYHRFFDSSSAYSNRNYAYEDNNRRKLIFLPYPPDYTQPPDKPPLGWSLLFKKAEPVVISGWQYGVRDGNGRLTAVVDSPLQTQWYVYIRRNIQLSGNPILIMNRLLRGKWGVWEDFWGNEVYRNFRFIDRNINDTSGFDGASFRRAYFACSYYDFNIGYRHPIMSEDEGAVLEEIKNILRSALVDMYVDHNNNFHLSVRRKKDYAKSNVSTIKHNSDIIDTELHLSSNKVYDGVSIRYAYDDFTEGSKFTKVLNVSKAGTLLTGTNIYSIESKWIQSKEDARHIANLLSMRYNRYFPTLHGILGPQFEEVEVGSLFEVASFFSPLSSIHPLNDGSYFEVTEVIREMGKNSKVILSEVSDFVMHSIGYGTWEDSSNGNNVSATSIFGWGTSLISGTEWTDVNEIDGTLVGYIHGCFRLTSLGTFFNGTVGSDDTYLIGSCINSTWKGHCFTWGDGTNQEIFRIDDIQRFYQSSDMRFMKVTRAINQVSIGLSSITKIATMADWQSAATCFNINGDTSGTVFKWG